LLVCVLKQLFLMVRACALRQGARVFESSMVFSRMCLFAFASDCNQGFDHLLVVGVNLPRAGENKTVVQAVVVCGGSQQL